MAPDNWQHTRDFLLENVLNGSKSVPGGEVKETLAALRKERVEAPHVYLSLGTNSLVSGAKALGKALDDYMEGENKEIYRGITGSLGYFMAEPAMIVQLPGKCRVVFQQVAPGKVKDILDGMLSMVVPEDHLLGQIRDVYAEPWDNVPFLEELEFFQLQRKLASRNCGIIDPGNIHEFIARGGFKAFFQTLRKHTHMEVCDLVEKSGLRGRGGAGYNSGKKWKGALEKPSELKYLIVNAEESDPGSMIDRFLIEGDPFKLIEGAAIAAYAIGARKILVYLRANHLLAIQRLEKAIEETKRFGFLGHDIFGSGYSLDISLAKGSGAFACGEETALIKSIEGKRGMPETKPPYPSDNGLFKKPTVVNSAETLYSVPDIMARGAGWFKTIGTEKSRGTKMIGLTGKINHQGILEIPMGTSMLDIIEKAGGGTRDNKPLKAVHVGGPSGGSIPPENLLVTYDYEQLSEAGCLMGSGGILVLDDSVCMVNLSKYFMDFIQKESCGKCIPCREGSRRMYEILDNISKRPRTETNHQTLERFKGVIQLESLSEVMKDTSLCGMGQAAPNAVLTALKWFREEFEDHIFDRNCKAGVCKDLRMYYIDVDKCTGCTACARKCPANAIVGTKHQPFFIVQEKCTACGICYETCKFDAISIV